MLLPLPEILKLLLFALESLSGDQKMLVEDRLLAAIELGATLEESDPTMACVLYHIGAGADAMNVLVSMGLLDE